jgi:CubicO group peptidase (beta-lactamase class C family)
MVGLISSRTAEPLYEENHAMAGLDSNSLDASTACAARGKSRRWLGLLIAAAVTGALQPAEAADLAMEERIAALVPSLETYIADGMKAFDNPGLAIGIVAGDKLVYAKGFGLRKKGGEPVDTRTAFQIGSTTKAFLATTMAIAVDRGRFKWDDRVVDLDPDFQLKDAWVTHEFRMFDIIAQRSGMPPYANDLFGIFGFDETALIRSLRHVEPVSSFRSSFAYTNITHFEAGRILARAADAPDWFAVLRADLFEPLGMTESSYTAAAIEAAPNHAVGHRWTPAGTVEVPFTQLFPYDFRGAGAINSTIEDMARWLRLQLGGGTFEGQRIVSPENLAATRMARVAMSDKAAYAMGWVVLSTPNGNVVWHNGGTTSFGAYVGLQLDKDVGVVVLTNEVNVGFPDAIGMWTFDRVLGNPDVDYVAARLKLATAEAERIEKLFAKPASPRPFPPIGPLVGAYAHPGFGKVTVRQGADALLMELTSGAVLKLDPWDGDVFTATLVPGGPFAAVAANQGNSQPIAFVQFQIGSDGKLTVLRLSTDDGQSYEFRRE